MPSALDTFLGFAPADEKPMESAKTTGSSPVLDSFLGFSSPAPPSPAGTSNDQYLGQGGSFGGTGGGGSWIGSAGDYISEAAKSVPRGAASTAISAGMGLGRKIGDYLEGGVLDGDVLDFLRTQNEVVGGAAQELIQKALPVTPGLEDSWTRKIGEGAGSTAPAVVAGVAGGPAGLAVFGGGQAYESTYKEVREMGGTHEDAKKYASFSAGVTAATEPLLGAVPKAFKIFKRLDKATDGKIVTIGKMMVGEGSQEGIQEIPNEVARQAYLKDRTLIDSLATIGESAVLGGTVGGLFGSVAVGIKAVVDRGNAKLLESYEQRVAAGQSDPTPSQAEFRSVGDMRDLSRKERAAEIQEIVANPPTQVITPESALAQGLTEEVIAGDLPNAPTGQVQTNTEEESQARRPATQAQGGQDEAQAQGQAEGAAVLETRRETQFPDQPAPLPGDMLPVKPAGQAGGVPRAERGTELGLVPRGTRSPSLASGMQAEQPKTFNDSVLAATKRLRDTTNTSSFKKHGFDGLSRDVQKVVMGDVRTITGDRQVFGRIVEDIPVDVMNKLIGSEFSPDDLTHNSAVLADILSVDFDLGIPKRAADVAIAIFDVVHGGNFRGQSETGQGLTDEGDRQTSLKNAAVDAQRAERGLDPVPKPEPRTFKELNETAAGLLAQNPNLGDEVMAELRTTRRAATDLQHAILSRVYHEADLRKETILRGIIEANESGDAERTVTLEAMREDADKRLAEIEEVSEPSGSEAGRALGIRRMGLTGDQFTLTRVVMEQEAAQGRKLTPDELRELSDLQAKLQSQQAELDALKEKAAAQEAEQAVKSVETKVKRERSSRSAKAKAEVDAVWAEVLPKFKGKLFSNPLDPELVAAGLKLAKAYIKLGASSIADFATAIKEKIGESKYQAHQDIWEEAWRVAVSENKPVVGKRNLKKSAGLSRFAHDLAKHFVETGVKSRDALIDAVHEELSAAVPGITRRQTMDAISGYGQYKLLSKEEVSAELRDLKGQMQQVGKLEDMAAGIAPRSTGIERRTPSDEERRLIAQVNEAKKKGGYKVTDPEKQLKTSLAAIETRLKNQIADLEAQIAKGERLIKTKTPPPTNDKIEALRAKVDDLREQLDAIAPKPELTDAQRLARYKDVLTRREAELQDRLARGDIEPKRRRDLSLDKEAEQKRLAVEQLKNEILRRREAARLAKRSTRQKIIEGAGEVLNTSRAILTSFDFSAVGRQGGILVAAHPRLAKNAMGDMFASFASEAAFSRAMNELRNRPNAGLYRRAKLSLTDPDGKLSAQEEAYMSRWAKHLAGVKHSERAYVAFLNRIRADVFDSMVASLGRGGTVTEAEAKIIANYANVATGRGDLGKFNQSATLLATVFFSPRYVLSRFQYLTLQPLRKGSVSGESSARARMLIAKEYARSLAGVGFFYATALAALTAMIGPPGDDEAWDVELDPRSSDFGKLRIGKTRIDPLFGLQQATVLISRVASGETKTLKGKVVPIRGEKVPFGTGNTVDVLARFARTKLSPAIGSVIDIASGKDVVGNRVTATGEAIEAVTPLSFREIYETMKEQGVPAGAAMGLLNIFGIAVQTYEDRKKKDAA